MTDDTIPVAAPGPNFYEARGGRIAARGCGSVLQVVHDNVSTEDARRLVQICVDALNREFAGRPPASLGTPIPLRGEVR